MSLSASLYTALSGLRATQTQIAVTSSNITNVNSEGYSKKIANTTSVTVSAGRFNVGGVKVDSIVRQVNVQLIAEARNQMGRLASEEVSTRYLSQAQRLFGDVGSNNSLGALIAELENIYEALGIEPNDKILQIDLLNKAQIITNDLNGAYFEIQRLRGEADLEIQDAIVSINNELERINRLNDDIRRANAAGAPIGDLEDQRDNALFKISEFIQVNAYTSANNEMRIILPTGSILLDGGRVNRLQYDSIGSTTSLSEFNEGSFRPITFEDPSTGQPDLTTNFKRGGIAALINMRDKTLPTLANQLEDVAKRLTFEVNKFHNQGTAYPPPQTLIGTNRIEAADPFYADGWLRIGILNNNGHYVDYVDVDMTAITQPGPTTINDVITALNNTVLTIDGVNTLSTLANFSIDTVSNTLRVDGVGNNRIALGTPPLLDPAIENVSGLDMGFSHFFGLNDLFESTTMRTEPNRLVSEKSYLVTDTFDAGVGGDLELILSSANSTAIQRLNVTLAGNLTIPQLRDAINTAAAAALPPLAITASLTVDGKFKLQANDSGLSVEVFLGNPSLTDANTGQNFLSFFNFQNPVHVTNSIKVRESLINNPTLLTRGQLASPVGLPTIPTTIVAPDFYAGITSGDNSIVTAINNVFKENFDFIETNTIGKARTTISGYANLILGATARITNEAKVNYESQLALKTELDVEKSRISGVNIDEELAQLVLLENAYNAAARVVTVTNNLFDELSNLV